MAILRRARNAPERMDAPEVDPGTLNAALHHIGAVNRWLGGRRALLRHLDWALPADPATHARVIDVGTGMADLPIAVARWARSRSRPVSIAAVDRHRDTIRMARQNAHLWPEVRLVRADGLRLPFPDAAFDVALVSMTLHHMEGDDLVRLLREAGRVARGGRVLVGELRRSVGAYAGARLLAATLWRGNPITRHDGPLSVLRAFTPSELVDLAGDAGLGDPRAFRHPLFRLVVRAVA